MKLLTLNCHSWQEDNQIEKIKYLARVINEKDYDVIALQEISQSIDAESIDGYIKENNFVLMLKNELDKYTKDKYDFYWDFSHIGYDIYEEGLAILTKHKVLNTESIFITKNHDTDYWKTRKIVKMTIDYKGNETDIYSCHLGWWHDDEEPFKYQADSLIDHLDNNRINILMGDFNNNAFVRGEGYDYLIGKGLNDLFMSYEKHDLGITAKGKIDGWDENRENLRLDLVLSNKEVKVNNAEVIFNRTNKEIISDHYGVEVEIDI